MEAFVWHLSDTEPHLDILINHAAQTVKRPLEFYAHLLAAEAAALPLGAPPTLLEARREYAGPMAPLLAQATDSLFPANEQDAYGQQVDRRPNNSWSLTLEEINAFEMLEVQLVNSIAPFLLCGQLKPLLLRSPQTRRFIINVSASEGQFEQPKKSARHPHTNMAKAALNMLTRTSAAEYAQCGIYMNSVDTGCVTDENPHSMKRRVRERDGFFTPLDVIDGAARVYDPVARSVTEPEQPLWGHFLKDYAPYPW